MPKSHSVFGAFSRKIIVLSLENTRVAYPLKSPHITLRFPSRTVSRQKFRESANRFLHFWIDARPRRQIRRVVHHRLDRWYHTRRPPARTALRSPGCERRRSTSPTSYTAGLRSKEPKAYQPPEGGSDDPIVGSIDASSQIIAAVPEFRHASSDDRSRPLTMPEALRAAARDGHLCSIHYRHLLTVDSRRGRSRRRALRSPHQQRPAKTRHRSCILSSTLETRPMYHQFSAAIVSHL